MPWLSVHDWEVERADLLYAYIVVRGKRQALGGRLIRLVHDVNAGLLPRQLCTVVWAGSHRCNHQKKQLGFCHGVITSDFWLGFGGDLAVGEVPIARGALLEPTLENYYRHVLPLLQTIEAYCACARRQGLPSTAGRWARDDE